MKKIFIAIAILLVSSSFLQAQTDTLMYIMRSGFMVNQLSIKPSDVDSIIFHKPVLLPVNQLALIPAGTFTMGSDVTELFRHVDETQHSVTLSTFRISKYEITNSQYAAFLNAKRIDSNRLDTLGPYPKQPLVTTYYGFLKYSGSQWVPIAGYENTPVLSETWYGAAEYAASVGGALPTEAQWEYACRAGTTLPFNTGDCLSYLQANYNWTVPYNTCSKDVTSHLGKILPVGTFAPNAYGLYDMHGNGREWCADWYDTYPSVSQTNPPGPATGTSRVVRGGGLADPAYSCRSAARLSNPPESNDTNLCGFRVVFAP